ncbi:MAG: hypothetical protein U9N14_03830, partial [Pseudomonadota bacterium]|nr:hypothetical protein [Pseudomonadota bacterium]
MTRSLLSALFAFTLLFNAVPAFAQVVTTEKAEQIRADIEAVFTDISADMNENIHLERDGTTSVTTMVDHYVIVLPTMAIKDKSGAGVEIDRIQLDLAPTDNEHIWQVAGSIPTDYSFIDADGTRQALLSIGKQKFEGIWNADLNFFLDLNAKLSDISLVIIDELVEIRVEDIIMTADYDEDAAGLFSGSG